MNKSMFKFRGIQIFAAVTAEAIKEAIKDLKTPEEIQAKLTELGTIKVETKEVVKEHTKESVNAFITQNKEYADSLYRSNIKNFLSGKLGKQVDEITDDEIKAELVTKSTLLEQQKKYGETLIDYCIKNALGDKAELLAPHIKKDLIKISDKMEVTGIDKEVERLKKAFPNQFEEYKPAGGSGKIPGKEINDLESLRKRAEETGSMKDRMDYSRALKETQNTGGEE